MRNFNQAVFATFTLLATMLVVAQQPASHSVTVAIPAILKLRLDASPSGVQAQVPVTIEVYQGVYAITPAASTLHVLANSGWQLSASYEPFDTQYRVALLWRVMGEWRALQPYPTRVMTGQASGGWQRLEVHYGLADLPPDGRYQGVVTYTLSRP
jgi:hypothetical protein